MMTDSSKPPRRFIGCDVGQSEIVACDGVDGNILTIPNRHEDLASFASSLDDECLVICEATGGHEVRLLDALTRAGRAAHRADARKVKAFIRSYGILGKSDAIDAHALARYGSERHETLARWCPPEARREQLQALVSTRRDLVTSHVAWRNRLAAPGGHHAEPHITAVVALLDQQIKAIDDEINTLVQSHQPFKKSAETLCDIAGIGAKTAATLIALMPELGSLKRRQAAALAGLAPHPRQSGATDAYRRTRGGRPDVKRCLFMAAMAARRHNKALKAFYLRLIAKGKKPLVALTAIMRKLVVIANAKLRDATIIQPSQLS
jgi:transposase